MTDTKTLNVTSDIPAAPKGAADEILIRRARLSDGPQIGRLAAKTYYDTKFTHFLSPKRAQYYSHYERGFKHRAQARLLQPNNVSWVACEKSNPDKVIGHNQTQRLGNDEGYKALMREQDTYLLRLMALVWKYWTWLVVFLHGGDKSADPAALKIFSEGAEIEEKTHWVQRPNRWEAQSVVVSKEFQGRGIGKKLMAKLIEAAERDRVVAGLHASEHGKYLYLSVGFKLLGDFQLKMINDGGGVMLYTPKSLQSKDE